jgi:hypothetical protein
LAETAVPGAAPPPLFRADFQAAVRARGHHVLRASDSPRRDALRLPRRGKQRSGCVRGSEQLDFHRDPNPTWPSATAFITASARSLARAEIEIALRRLFTRFPRVAFEVPRSQIQFVQRPGTRGLVSLPILLG